LWRELEESGGAIITPAAGRAIAEALGPVLDAARRARMAEAGQRWARRLLDADALVQAYVAMYQAR
jgi:hypothetical protein